MQYICIQMKPALSIRYLTIDRKDSIYKCFVGGFTVRTGMYQSQLEQAESHEQPVDNYDEVLDAWELLWATKTIDKHLVESATLVEGGSYNGRSVVYGRDVHSWRYTDPLVPLGQNPEKVLGIYWAGPEPVKEEAPEAISTELPSIGAAIEFATEELVPSEEEMVEIAIQDETTTEELEVPLDTQNM